MPEPQQAEQEILAEIDTNLGRGMRVPLAAALLGVLLLVALAPVVFFSLLTAREMRYQLVVAQQEHQLQLASSLAQRLDDFVDHTGREAGKIGESLAAFSPDEGRAANPYLGDLLDETIALARFRSLDGTGPTAVKSDLPLPLVVEQALERDAALVLEQGPALLDAQSATGLVSGPFTLGPERLLAITVSAPVKQRRRLVGVFQEVALFDRVWRAEAAGIPPSSRLFLLRRDGSIAALGPGGAGESEQSIRQREIVQQFLQMRGRSRGASLAYEVPGRNGEKRRMLGSFAATSHSWGVFVEVDEKLALGPSEQFARKATYAGALAAGLAILAALVLGAAISRPITRLAHISKRLAEKDFSVEAAASPVAELDTLALNFNLMARRLGELVERFRAAARETNDMFLGTIRALAEAIDEKDPYTKGHSVRVNRYSVVLGRYMGLSREEMRAVQISSLLHDVGKIGIEDRILKKTGPLSPEEFEVMKTHPERGAKIMGRIPQMKNIIPGMRFHHEKYVGGGYPLGLRREEIPLIARIIAVADAFDAMVTDRPYQKAHPVPAAVAKINELKGKTLDPQVVEAFNRAYEAGELDDILTSRPFSLESQPVESETADEAVASSTAS